MVKTGAKTEGHGGGSSHIFKAGRPFESVRQILPAPCAGAGQARSTPPASRRDLRPLPIPVVVRQPPLFEAAPAPSGRATRH